MWFINNVTLVRIMSRIEYTVVAVTHDDGWFACIPDIPGIFIECPRPEQFSATRAFDMMFYVDVYSDFVDIAARAVVEYAEEGRTFLEPLPEDVAMNKFKVAYQKIYELEHIYVFSDTVGVLDPVALKETEAA